MRISKFGLYIVQNLIWMRFLAVNQINFSSQLSCCIQAFRYKCFVFRFCFLLLVALFMGICLFFFFYNGSWHTFVGTCMYSHSNENVSDKGTWRGFDFNERVCFSARVEMFATFSYTIILVLFLFSHGSLVISCTKKHGMQDGKLCSHILKIELYRKQQ